MTLRIGPIDPNARDVVFTDDSSLAHESRSADAIEISGVLEHATPAAVTRLFLECHRVLRGGGELSIDVPNASRVLDAWRRGDLSTSDASAFFCTFESGAYVGPVRVDRSSVETILGTKTPFRAAVDLRRLVIDSERAFRFRRQNAYSDEELARTLRASGFDVVSVSSRAGDVLRVVAKPAAPSEEHYRLAYHLHGEEARAAHPRAADEAFTRDGVRIGRLDDRATQRFVESLSLSDQVKLAIDDYAPGFVHNPDLNDDDLGEINASHAFLALGRDQLERVTPLLEGLAPPIEACLRSPFRVVNLRVWTSHPQGIPTQTNDWHNDEGFPADVLKVMVYLSGASETIGSTEVALARGEKTIVSGPPGTFLVFKNYALTHRGVMPREGERLVLEVTVVPSFATETRPALAGLNAEFPKVP